MAPWNIPSTSFARDLEMAASTVKNHTINLEWFEGYLCLLQFANTLQTQTVCFVLWSFLSSSVSIVQFHISSYLCLIIIRRVNQSINQLINQSSKQSSNQWINTCMKLINIQISQCLAVNSVFLFFFSTESRSIGSICWACQTWTKSSPWIAASFSCRATTSLNRTVLPVLSGRLTSCRITCQYRGWWMPLVSGFRPLNTCCVARASWESMCASSFSANTTAKRIAATLSPNGFTFFGVICRRVQTIVLYRAIGERWWTSEDSTESAPLTMDLFIWPYPKPKQRNWVARNAPLLSERKHHELRVDSSVARYVLPRHGTDFTIVSALKRPGRFLHADRLIDWWVVRSIDWLIEWLIN